MAFALAASGALRWGPRHRRTRSILLPLGLNLAALALLAALLAAGTEPGGLSARWTHWWLPFGLASLLALAAFRFPRSVGVPVAVAAAAGVWLIAGAIKEFAPVEADTALPVVQPLSDRELVTAFALRVDELRPPRVLPLLPKVLYRWRPGDASPPEWWWTWAKAQGWAVSTGAAMPDRPLKFGVYRLALELETPTWRLERPELAPPR